MITSILRQGAKSVFIFSVAAGILGAEAAISPFAQLNSYLNENVKLVMDTRSLVAKKQKDEILREKEDILRSLRMLARRLSEEEREQLGELIYKESQEHIVDPQLIVALIAIESGFRKEARSRANARGLMQVRFPTALEIAGEIGMVIKKSKSLHEPHLNIRMGTYYLVKMMRRFNNLELALTAYNIGPTALRRIMGSRKKKLPRRYSRRVLNTYKQLRLCDYATTM